MLTRASSTPGSIAASPCRPLTRKSISPPKVERSVYVGDVWKDKQRKFAPAWLTTSHLVALVAICSSMAAATTAVLAVLYLSAPWPSSSSSAPMTRVGGWQGMTSRAVHDFGRSLQQKALPPVKRAHTMPKTDASNNADAVQPHVVWLMSFPNSGTSFTIHMTREATNCTTATNYALEGEIKDQPSVQAISGPQGANGPFFELIPNRHTSIPDTILTKTHCAGFCSGQYCGPRGTFRTVRSFMVGCLTGTKAIQDKDGTLKKVPVTYNASLVTKAIHIFRHPLDNVVARFHLEYNVQQSNRHVQFSQDFTKDANGFQAWCAADDRRQHILYSYFVDDVLRSKMRHIPCMNEFFRYVQWHNNAFSMARDMGLPTLLLHYDEYDTNFAAARSKVLSWLDLPRVGEGIDFYPGKIYRHYYTAAQKWLIRDFLREASSMDTWQQLQHYDFFSHDQEMENEATAKQ